MSRDPSGIYSYPDGTRGSPGTTIYSARYNTFLDDLATTLNTKLPINMGGTGADDAAEARDNLKAEVASAAVTDFNTHVWENGSFNYGANTPGAPTVNPGVGWVVVHGNPAYAYMQVRDVFDTGVVTTKTYTRTKYNGVWAGWTVTGDETFVNQTGDTMSGPLTVNSVSGIAINSPAGGNALLNLNKPGSGTHNLVQGSMAGKARWLLSMGDTTAETGANAGSNFTLHAYNDAGDTNISIPLTINRANGRATFGGDVFAPNIHATTQLRTYGWAGDVNNSIIFFSQDTSRYLNYVGGVYGFVGGTVNAGNGRLWGASDGTPIWTTGGTISGTLNVTILNATNVVTAPQFTASSAIVLAAANPMIYIRDAAHNQKMYLYWDPNTNICYMTNVVGATHVGILPNGDVQAGFGIACRWGRAGSYRGNCFNIDWSPANLYIDTTNLGTIAFTSDYRTKKDVVDLPGMWDVVKNLRPIKYTQADYTPPPTEKNPEPKPLFKADNVERWGFIAHELQATMIDYAATGVKDAPDVVQSPNPWVVIAALTKALQEAMTRIEALEARL